MFRAVLFDVDDTLCDDTGHMRAAIDGVAAQLSDDHSGIDANALADCYERISTHYWTYEIALTDPEPLSVVRTRLWQRSLAAMGVDDDPRLLGEIVRWYGHLRAQPPALFDGVHETLTTLRDAGMRLGIVTNGLSETHVAKVERLGLRGYFDAFLMPDLTGIAKPDPRQFHLACRQLDVAPGETAHVGDSLVSDVGGASAAGLHAVWFNPHGRAPDAQAARPHAEVRSLREVPGRLTGAAPRPTP